MALSKLPNTKGSIFSTVNKLVTETGAIDLSLGKTDFPCPEKLADLAATYIRSGYNNFAPHEGISELREVISERVKTMYNHTYNPETEITITAGNVQAIMTAISSVVKEDDEVILFEPAYESYAPAISINGGRPVYVTLKQPNFHIDWEEVRKMITSKTRMIIINSPHNPTGAVLSDSDLVQLQHLTNGTNIVILSDEVFESIVFDNNTHQSVARYEKLANRSFIVSSFGPLFNINGWGLAYILAPEKLMNDFRRIQQFQIYNVNTPLQYALSEFLQTEEANKDISEMYQGKRNYFNRLLNDSLFKVLPSQGSYFEILDYSKISDESDTDFTFRLANEFGVGVIPVSAFMHEKNKLKMVRICFAKNSETLEKAAERLRLVPSIK
ncbi:MAG: aminotransferase class I/II-fold pyridoxal phosphate-dependent enzyme [Prolixibacteraceae bacterium]|jgi:methionine aminotransferase|nr:aminotransferase class I/II-fold pyridoxal phosphate-dependent enzyme [Prolixibacteraceae bacterium]